MIRHLINDIPEEDFDVEEEQLENIEEHVPVHKDVSSQPVIGTSLNDLIDQFEGTYERKKAKKEEAKRVAKEKAEYVDRNKMIAMQSPEAHRLSILNEVFAKTDRMHHPLIESCCTMLMYNLGYSINFIESSINNIKIARSEDLATFSAYSRNDN